MSKEDDKKDLAKRPAPFLRHVSVGPPGAATDFLKEQLNKQARTNFNSSSLTTPAVVGEKGEKNQPIEEKAETEENAENAENPDRQESQEMSKKNVNRTALHPGGVQ